MKKSKGFRSDKQRRGFFASVQNKSRAVKQRMPSRKNQATKDHINRLDRSIENDEEQLREYNIRLANASSSEEKKMMQRKKRITRKKIKRKKQDRKQALKLDKDTHMVMKKTHSNYNHSEQLVKLVNRRGYDVEEIDWEELQGADLSYEQKEHMLISQIKEEKD